MALRLSVVFVFGAACAASEPAHPDLGCAQLEDAPCAIRPEAVQSVEPLWATSIGKGGLTHRLRGAAVVMIAEPAMTKELLERNTNCRCPWLSGSTVTVESGHGSFRVEIRSDDAEAILSRARAVTTKTHP